MTNKELHHNVDQLANKSFFYQIKNISEVEVKMGTQRVCVGIVCFASVNCHLRLCDTEILVATAESLTLSPGKPISGLATAAILARAKLAFTFPVSVPSEVRGIKA